MKEKTNTVWVVHSEDDRCLAVFTDLKKAEKYETESMGEEGGYGEGERWLYIETYNGDTGAYVGKVKS
jgi:hypothetical protein